MKQIYDVIVVGGGPAGIMAAMASGKLGADTLLIEKNGFLGGAATASVLGPISPFHYKDEQVINGIPQDFMDRMVKEAGSTGHMKTLDPYGSGDSLGFYDREKYKYVAVEMLKEFGVDILYHSMIDSVDCDNFKLTGLTTVSKGGDRLHFSAHVIVDATGDGDIAVRCGENYCIGDPVDHKFSPSSAMFEMANVDTEKVFRYIQENQDDFEFLSDIVPMREFDDRLKQHYFVGQGFKKLVKKAVEAGDLEFGRDSVIVLNGIHPNTMHFNATRICGLDATDVVKRTESEIDGRRQINSVSEFMIKYVPDLHNPDGKEGYGNGGVWKVPKDTYDIPYRCLIPKHIDGLILSGRCISGTSEAHGSYRTQGGIMGIGQASGIAAAVCAKNHIQPREQEVKEIQEELIRIGASVYRDEEKTKAEKARARKIAQEYIKEHEGNLITLPEILKEYED